jgi:hypothetical protein
MTTDCKQTSFEFQGIGSRKVVADFGAGDVSSDGGGLLLREMETKRQWIQNAAKCFSDGRNPDLIEHSVSELCAQLVYGLALGYEDLNDHDRLCTDPLLAVLCGKEDPSGQDRRRSEDRGKPLAGKSTLNRLQLSTNTGDRYKRIVCNEAKMENLFIDQFINRPRKQAPSELILDLDATDDPIHGMQEGRFFQGYYGHYCYLPLYIFCGSELLCAKLRPANIDGAAGSVEEVERIVSALREKWPDVRIILRGDSGFCRENLMAWCEENGVDFIFGLARNARLLRMIKPSLQSAARAQEILGGSVRVYQELRYQTRTSWSKKRRVVAKAEILPGKQNPRFIVTSLGSDYAGAAVLYEVGYCARGDMENRIKEQQLGLFADRTSTHTLRANQLRVWLSAIAYSLLNDLRELVLHATKLARAQCSSLRVWLMKIGALIKLSVRRIYIQMASAFPMKAEFAIALEQIGKLSSA